MRTWLLYLKLADCIILPTPFSNPYIMTKSSSFVLVCALFAFLKRAKHLETSITLYPFDIEGIAANMPRHRNLFESFVNLIVRRQVGILSWSTLSLQSYFTIIKSYGPSQKLSCSSSKSVLAHLIYYFAHPNQDHTCCQSFTIPSYPYSGSKPTIALSITPASRRCASRSRLLSSSLLH